MSELTDRIRHSAGQAAPLQFEGVRITALCDGHADIDLSRFPSLDRDAARPLADAGEIALDDMAVSVNAFLIETPERRYLVDAGNGAIRGPGLGHLRTALGHAGCRPDDVDVVLMTHMHGDHCVGLYEDGRAVFARAEMVVSEAERDFWADEAGLNEMQRSQLDFARSAFAAYAGRTALTTPGREVAPGIEMVALPGHTPGHVGYLIGAAKVLIWGDIVHVPALQIPRPEWYFRFDADPETAIATRRRILERAADDDLIVAGAHLPFPGMARITRDGEQFIYLPVDL
jgi:glyoxylase-like metal-dependent hydrolase (beta-lactamase superfamily II)